MHRVATANRSHVYVSTCGRRGAGFTEHLLEFRGLELPSAMGGGSYLVERARGQVHIGCTCLPLVDETPEGR